jgi:predicted nucleic acid-binding protein
MRSQERFHTEARRLLDQVGRGDHIAVEPLTVLVEVVAAIRRRTGSEPLAARAYLFLRSLRGMRFVEFDVTRAEAAQQAARRFGLRGMDAVVIQTAGEFGTSLVTLDQEMARRVDGSIAAVPITDF